MVFVKHNVIKTDIVLKKKDDTNCDWETALVWTLSVKIKTTYFHL